MHAVCSIEAGTPGEWQAALLAYSWHRLGEPTPLTVLCAGGPPTRETIDADIVVTPNYRYVDGGDYVAWNKPMGLCDWLGTTAAQDILIIDADFMLLECLPDVTAVLGHPQGQVNYALTELSDTPVRNLTVHPQLLAPVGVPILIARRDLDAMLPRWIEQLYRVRRAGLPFGWVAEMYAYILGAADVGLQHILLDDMDCGSPFVHYYVHHCVRFWKGWYGPWRSVPITADMSAVEQRFRTILNECASLKRAQAVTGP